MRASEWDRQGFLPWVALGLVGVALVLIPPEDTIGGRIRLVYAHGAGIWVGMLLYNVAALVVFVSLLRRRWSSWGLAIDLVGTGFWLVSDVLALISMKVVWGGLFLAEPRLVTAAKIVTLSLAVHALCWAVASVPARALLVVGRTAAAWWWVATTELVMHPDRPVLKAELSMQVPFLALLVAYVFLALAVARVVHRRLAPFWA